MTVLENNELFWVLNENGEEVGNGVKDMEMVGLRLGAIPIEAKDAILNWVQVYESTSGRID